MVADYSRLAREARRKVLSMIHKAKTSHIASNFSVIDIATVLYENLKDGDEVVWSKGWAAATIYYFLAKQGKIPQEDLEKFPNAPYLGLAETTVNGVLCNGGSVGHGSPIAVGIALGKKRAGEIGTVYCIMSDGELNEGSVWESVMLASHHKLNNLVFIIDVNKFQAMGRTNDVIDLEPIEDRFIGFGWKALRIDGHSFDHLQGIWEVDFADINPIAGTFAQTTRGAEERMKHKPLVVICDTVKGKGVSFMENKLEYHYKHVTDEDYEKALAELV